MTRRTKAWLGGADLLMAAFLAWLSFVYLAPRSPVISFDATSDKLKATQVVATLDSPIPAGKNAIWCASFLCAWKPFQRDMGGSVALEGSPPLAAALDGTPDPTPQVPAEALYVAAGWAETELLARIAADVPKQFPGTPPPSFPGIGPDYYLAYSCLRANVHFALPYFQNRKPLMFKDSGGKQTPVVSFGIRSEDEYSYYKLREQASVLFAKGQWSGYGTSDSNNSFAVDLDADSEPSQIVVALIPRQPSLAAALATVEKEIGPEAWLGGKGRKKQKGPATSPGFPERLGPDDVLLVPDLFWRLSHHFTELERKGPANAMAKGPVLVLAQQDILFRLGRSGAELGSEAKILYLCSGPPFVLERPFLIYMKKRGAAAPYFAMWVDNAELLQQW